jgi:hypothetical protein
VYSLSFATASMPVATAVERPPSCSALARWIREIRPSSSLRAWITVGVSSVESSTKTTR